MRCLASRWSHHRRVLRHAALLLLAALGAAAAAPAPPAAPWIPDRGDGTYQNPVLHADYSDPDAVRVGDTYYLVSSSFSDLPGLPVLRSRDLVNWTIAGHALQRLPSPAFDTPQHGKGVWAPSLRHHAGRFYVYWGDPDAGIFMTSAVRAEGPWDEPVLVKAARGRIDPCPLWDADGKAWLVHAWAKSRAGFNARLTVVRLSLDGRQALDEGTTVFEGGERHPTIEGPKLYAKDGWYWIFAPAGGVQKGWQVALRSRAILGPYEDRIVLAQGRTQVNGPHQGAWVDAPDGSEWFLHFQDKGAYGRVVHLQPMRWRDGWPVMGEDPDGDGVGEPVASWRMPPRPREAREPRVPQTSDTFDGGQLGLQWQWAANPDTSWWSLRGGALTLRAVPAAAPGATLWSAGHLLLQKLPALAFTARTLLHAEALGEGATAGLVLMGRDYAFIGVTRRDGRLALVRRDCLKADSDGAEAELAARPLAAGPVELRVEVADGAVCRFSARAAGESTFAALGESFTAREGMWIGAKVGLFAGAPQGAAAPGSARFDELVVGRPER